MLKSEVKSIGKLDMSKFGCDFKSKDLPSGAHILNNNHGWNMDICNRDDCIGQYELPPLEPCDVKPHDLISFNFCKTATDFNCGVHFCIDDYQFERVWNEPHKYVDLLKKFECVVCPDFSVYIDMPYPMKLWNIYRSRALGFFWQILPQVSARKQPQRKQEGRPHLKDLSKSEQDCKQKLCNGKTRERLTESKENVEEKLILSSAVATLRGDRKQEELLISWTLAIEIWLITILKNSQRLLTLA